MAYGDGDDVEWAGGQTMGFLALAAAIVVVVLVLAVSAMLNVRLERRRRHLDPSHRLTRSNHPDSRVGR